MTQQTTKTNTGKREIGCGTSLARMVLALAFLKLFSTQSTVFKLILLAILILGPGRSSLKEFRELTARCTPHFVKGAKAIFTSLRKKAAAMFSNLSHSAQIAADFLQVDDQITDEESETPSGDSSEDSSESPSGNTAPAHEGFIPKAFCKRILTDEDARKLATSWWCDADENGDTGETRLMNLISTICSEDPSIHTALISGEKELRLPTEALAISHLIEIFKENGIAADLTPDDEVIISWGQDENGAEVSM